MKAKVTVLLVPASLREKVLRLDYPTLVDQYRLPRLVGAKVLPLAAEGELHVLSYETFSSLKHARVLEELQPDLIVCDEAHALRHASAARTKRFLAYFKEHRDCRLAVLSGTMTSRSIKDYAHLAWLALRENAPIPTKWSVLEEWATAIDAAPFRAPAGALSRLCEDGEDARDGFRRRLVETEGVVATSESVLGTGLVLRERPLKLGRATAEAVRKMRRTWTTPDQGEAFDDVLVLHRYLRQMAAGFYYRWVWPRNEPDVVRETWLDARRAWHREVANFLTYRAEAGIDSPLGYAKACADGKVRSKNYLLWQEVRDTARPETEPVWLGDELVDDAIAWARSEPGIVWVEHAALGQRIAERSGLKHYGAGDDGILYEKGDRSVVASIRAHGTGKNLQRFSRNLVTTPPTSGSTWEQLLGRTHRSGQQADEVTFDVYRHTNEMSGAVTKAFTDAQYQFQATGSPQKLLQATVMWQVTNG